MAEQSKVHPKVNGKVASDLREGGGFPQVLHQ